ncbi:helix-turn-helix family protein [Clostridium argentinense CDC 2741]|uniref:Helix-turn-helix family protein n=1 Tax=Clostridium argentinense CDC 2741 TaxID=1418104 RepID=A0A0C1QZV1_9CLOT|nr:helix-turn-helix transcriptional regulator [Clostridium argentinense]ARC86359.1 transcriptional regulator [Clostridium argentinense]KIE46647.1 helix-turn-helix family protein [Clostridium argentinense CDC 2741]NFF41391.1 helix-turn-helix transcriptional regulator [Clostridium argentinense]NFP52488.1 helix-turn-helix transcriptional regulator [Clostridium argentinense]NFP71209.1 helix-turn-helix transcriptional regulator [Clostridium argentinense]
MSLGERLLYLRKKAGLSQEDVAEKLNVSRQTVSKWETNQTVPELIKAKLLSQLYNVSYDYLISESHIGGDVTSIEMIVDEIDWTSAWSKKYPILASYQGIEGINTYCEKISELYDTFKNEFNFNDVDTVLILKDILYQKYKMEKKKNK